MAEAGVPASIADRAAIVAALQVLCALPECARGALNARSTKSGLSLNYSGKRKLQTSIWAACKKSCVVFGLFPDAASTQRCGAAAKTVPGYLHGHVPCLLVRLRIQLRSPTS
jgi:hypothetical protein